MLKITLKICLPVLLLTATLAVARAYVSPGQPTGLVNDFANVLSAEQKQQLENKLEQFKKDSSNEIAVAVINSLQDDTIENFAEELFKEWGIGQKGKDNGVLILVAKEDRKMRIEVGYGLEGDLTDAQSGWIINQIMKPAFADNNFYQGLDQAADKIIGATKGEVVPSDQPTTGGKKLNIQFIFGAIVFGFIWLASVLGRSKSWWLGGVLGGIVGVVIGFFVGFLYLGIIAIAVLAPLGLLFDFIVSKKYQAGKASGYLPWWIGGGGFGGGSGGGFGGFGGGSSGGGGASGDW
jgi:uncharacterized protein